MSRRREARVAPETLKVDRCAIIAMPSSFAIHLIISPRLLDLERPQLNLERPQLNLERSQLNLERSQLDLEQPQLDLERPQIDLERPQIDLERPDFSRKSPDFDRHQTDLVSKRPHSRTTSDDLRSNCRRFDEKSGD